MGRKGSGARPSFPTRSWVWSAGCASLFPRRPHPIPAREGMVTRPSRPPSFPFCSWSGWGGVPRYSRHHPPPKKRWRPLHVLLLQVGGWGGREPAAVPTPPTVNRPEPSAPDPLLHFQLPLRVRVLCRPSSPAPRHEQTRPPCPGPSPLHFQLAFRVRDMCPPSFHTPPCEGTVTRPRRHPPSRPAPGWGCGAPTVATRPRL